MFQKQSNRSRHSEIIEHSNVFSIFPVTGDFAGSEDTSQISMSR